MDLWAVILVGGIAGGTAVVWLSAAGSGVRNLIRGHRLGRRERRANAAALDAALTDPPFDPEQIRRDAAALLSLVEGRGDDARQWTPELEVWRDARHAFLGSDVRVDHPPRVDVMRVVNRPGQEEDCVVVRMRWRARHATGAATSMDERWVLGLRDGLWVLLAAHGDPTADALLTAPLVAAPDVDDAELTHAGLTEVADAVDDRFMPALLESTVTRTVAAWSEATNGQPAALDRCALDVAQEHLLRAGDGWRVLDDARLEHWKCADAQPDAVPPTATVVLEVTAAQQVRYADRRSTGSPRVRRTLKLRWTLQAIGPPEDPWRLVASQDDGPPESPGWQPLGLPIRVTWGRRSGPR